MSQGSKHPKQYSATGRLVAELAYGENHWQSAALYASASPHPLSLINAQLVEGSQPSYINLADSDRLLDNAAHVAAAWHRNLGHTPLLAIGAKHGNACGAAVGDDPRAVIKAMLDGDQRAIFGGEVLVNFPIGVAEAEVLRQYKIEQGRRLLDVLLAPAIEPAAVQLLKRSGGKLRILVNTALATMGEAALDHTPRLRPIRGGFLLQDSFDHVLDYSVPALQTYGPAASNQHKQDLLLAWAIGSMSNSNTITLVKNGQLIGNGVGQQDRVSGAQLALKRARDAGHQIKGAVAYSDSFFPFPDGALTLAEAGVAAILTTSGSVNDEQVMTALAGAKVAVLAVPDALGRGFYGH